MSIELRPHQVEAVAKMHNGCILYGGVGVGKTITSLGYYFERVCGGEINKWGSMKTPKDVYVITTAKVRDGKGFELTAAKYGIFADPEVSTNGVKITVDSWNNIHKYLGVENAFFIFDEQRVVGYGAWSKSFIRIAKANEWILLSATPGDTWLDYIPVFIANGWYKHKTDFIDQHVIWTPRVKYPKVQRYQNVGVLVRRRNQVLVHMPYERHTVRHPKYIYCDYDTDKFERVVKKKWHVYEDRPLRDVAEQFSVMRKVVNSDESRISAVRDLLGKHPRLIVFYNFDYELEILRELGSQLIAATESIAESAPSHPLPRKRYSSGEQTEYSNGGQSDDRSSASESSSKEPARRTSSSTAQSDTCENSMTTCPNSSTTPSHISERTAPTVPTELGSDSDISSAIFPDVTANGTTASSSEGSFAVAEWNGHKHEDIPTTERWLYLVQYRAGAEGWDCVETDAIVFFSQTYSYRDWWQAHGRIDRLNTPFTDLYYYHLVSKSMIDTAIRKALKTKKNFNERDLVVR